MGCYQLETFDLVVHWGSQHVTFCPFNLSGSSLIIRPYDPSDWPNLWPILQSVFQEGTTYAIDMDVEEQVAKEFWTGAGRTTWVVVDNGEIEGSYFLRKNQQGGGSHVCNCGYATSRAHRGKGIATLMCEHSQQQALDLGFKAMQFNFVVSTNEGAIRLWKKMGFEEVGRLPNGFNHPQLGLVDAIVMFKWL